MNKILSLLSKKLMVIVAVLAVIISTVPFLAGSPAHAQTSRRVFQTLSYSAPAATAGFDSDLLTHSLYLNGTTLLGSNINPYTGLSDSAVDTYDVEYQYNGAPLANSNFRIGTVTGGSAVKHGTNADRITGLVVNGSDVFLNVVFEVNAVNVNLTLAWTTDAGSSGFNIDQLEHSLYDSGTLLFKNVNPYVSISRDKSYDIHFDYNGSTLANSGLRVKSSTLVNATAHPTNPDRVIINPTAETNLSVLVEFDVSIPEIDFVATAGSGAESTNSAIVVKLNKTFSEVVTVDVSTANGTAVAPGDYTAVTTQTVTFNPGETQKTVNVTVIDDNIEETDETFTVNLSNPSANSILAPGYIPHTYTITNNDATPTVQFTNVTTSADEAAGLVNVEATLSNPTVNTVTVVYSLANVTASGADYAETSTSPLTFNPGVTSQNVQLTLVNDTLDEDDESLTITLSSPSNATLGVNTVNTFTITDNDNPPTVYFTLAASSSLETISPTTVQVELSAASSKTITVEHSTLAIGTATLGVDYTIATASPLSFAPGDTTKLITINVINDAIAETDETIGLDLKNPVNATLGGQTLHTYTINDDDSAGLNIQFLLSNESEAENVGTAQIAVVLNSTSSQTVTVDYAVTGGTASDGGVDYTLVAGTLTFTAGVTSQNINIPVVDDILDENDETIVLQLSNAVNANLGSTTVNTLTITDNDPVPTVQYALTSSSAGENAGTANLEVILSSASGKAITVDYTVTGGTATGGGTDYTLANGTLNFAPGDTSENITINIIDDAIIDPGETVIVDVLNPTNATLGANTQHTFTINDNEAAPSVFFTNASSAGDESTSPIAIQVTLAPASSQTVTVDYAVTGGTATSPADYTLASGTLTFLAGVLTQDVVGTVVDDLLDENNETIIITLSNPSGGVIGINGVHTYTITDNDPGPNVMFTNVSQSGGEGNTPANIQVSLSALSGLDISVDYAVTGGTATGSGTDYTLANGTLTITAGQISADISMTVIDDILDEADETVIITISNPVNSSLGANTVHTYTIQDNDPSPNVQFAVTTSSGLENITPANLVVDLSVVSAQTVTVDYAVTAGTATGAGVDYTLASGTLTFNPGDLTKNIPIVIVDDAIVELAETIEVTLSNPGNASLGGVSVHTYSISDNDGANTIQFNLSNSSVAENVTPALIPVSLNAASSQTITVDYTVTGGTATGGGTDYILANGTLTFVPSDLTEDITVVIVDDVNLEGNETVEITLSNPTNTTLGTTTVHTLTIQDDEGNPTVEFPSATSSGTEGTSPANVAVTLSGSSTNTITVDYAVTAGSATGGGVDYTLVNGTLTFNPGSTSENIPVVLIDDALVEGPETLTLTLSNATNSVLGATTVSNFTLHDNDPGFIINTPIITNEYGLQDTFTMALSTLPTADVVIAVSSSNTTEGTVSIVNLTFTPLNGTTAQTVTVTGADDPVVDGNIAYTIILAPDTTTTDLTYNGMDPADINAINIDNETPGISVIALTGTSLSTSETGTTDSFEVILNVIATANVTIGISSGDASEGSVSTNSVTLTAVNPPVPVQVTVTGIDDVLLDGDITYNVVTAPAVSTDLTYNGVDPADVSVTNIDDETGTPGFTVAPGILGTQEGGPSVQFTVVLDTQPTADVTINLLNTDATEGTFNPTVLTFGTVNWNIAQLVTVTPVDDSIADGTIGYLIQLLPAVSTDPNYNGLDPADVSVTNADNDFGGGGGGGGGGALVGGGSAAGLVPSISVTYNGKQVSGLTTSIGKEITVDVVATKSIFYSTASKFTLILKDDPSSDSKSPAVFNITESSKNTIVATLTWAPTAGFRGINRFTFMADSGIYQSEKSFTIKAIRGLVERADEACNYSDNNTDSVYYLCKLGIIEKATTENNYQGVSKDNKFFTHNTVDRAEFNKMVVNVIYEESAIEKVAKLISDNNIFPFPDVEPLVWFAKYIALAKDNDLIHGYSDGNFIPWNPIERSEAFKILINVSASKNVKIENDLTAAEAELGSGAAWFAKFDKLVNDYDGFHTPTDVDPGITLSHKMTRQEAADVMYKVIQNAGIETNSKLSELKIKLEGIKVEEGVSA